MVCDRLVFVLIAHWGHFVGLGLGEALSSSHNIRSYRNLNVLHGASRDNSVDKDASKKQKQRNVVQEGHGE